MAVVNSITLMFELVKAREHGMWQLISQYPLRVSPDSPDSAPKLGHGLIKQTEQKVNRMNG